jgi:hypothetical protein
MYDVDLLERGAQTLVVAIGRKVIARIGLRAWHVGAPKDTADLTLAQALDVGVEDGHVVSVYLRISDPAQMPAADHVWEVIVAVYNCRPLVSCWGEKKLGNLAYQWYFC